MNLYSANQEEQLQLYSILNSLSASVSDKDDLGMLVGYSIVKGLINFKTNTGSKIKHQKRGKKIFHPDIIEQIHFEEVKNTYNALKNTQKSVLQVGVSSCLSDILSDIDPKITDLLTTKDYGKIQSMLMKNILASVENSPRTYKDILRRDGLRVTEDVHQRRYFIRPHDFLINDYESIKKCFVDKTIYKIPTV